MSEGWQDRLKEAADRDGRSYRAISKAAGAGPNYLSEVLADGKVPGIDKFQKICAELNVSAAYVLTGSEVSREDEEMLAALGSLTPEQRSTFRALVRQLKASQP
jgi:transcriptional regulator with XRE-family HTH domain